MNIRPTFDETVNILVQAYLNDTLEHGSCSACAVGNIVAHHAGYSFHKRRRGPVARTLIWDQYAIPSWSYVFFTPTGCLSQRINPSQYTDEAKRQIDATGYTWKELARIEFAFETADRGNSSDEWMFNGLMAVLDVLADIHGIDLETKQAAKSLFVKA